jgi:hypothetical protein
MQKPARYLVLIELGGSMVAHLFDDDLRQVADIDAGSEEVAVMTTGLQPQSNADQAFWDAALSGHSAAERRAAQVYTLDV